MDIMSWCTLVEQELNSMEGGRVEDVPKSRASWAHILRTYTLHIFTTVLVLVKVIAT